MGRPKALLPLGNRTFIERLVSTLGEAGAKPVLVVTRPELEPPLRALIPQAQIVINRQPDQGMLSSILVGLDAVPPAPGFLLALVDQPHVRADTVRRLLAAFQTHPRHIVVPSKGSRRGHPIVFPTDCASELRQAPPDQGARAVVRKDPARVLTVTTDDEAILADVNTPEDLRTLEETLRQGNN